MPKRIRSKSGNVLRLTTSALALSAEALRKVQKIVEGKRSKTIDEIRAILAPFRERQEPTE